MLSALLPLFITAHGIAAHMRAQFAAAGLEVADQPLSLRAAKLDDTASTLTIDGKPLVHRKDCLIAPDFARETVDASAPLVLAGFGVSAPELKYDDYQN